MHFRAGRKNPDNGSPSCEVPRAIILPRGRGWRGQQYERGDS
jgi:hypothetical protein